MENFKELSFDNIEVNYSSSDILGEKLNITVLDNDGDCLAESKCEKISLKEFVSNWFYTELLEPEINYFFLHVFNNKEREKTDKMPLDKYIKYINNKYGEDEASVLNSLYETYISLKNYISSNLLLQHYECVIINSINSSYEETGAGTLIIDYLKETYELIFLYSTEEAEGYWLDKAGFKEILNGFMYWTNNEKLNEIL